MESKIKYGINVAYESGLRIDYADLIVSGIKTIETRNNRNLDKFIGQRVGVIRTGKGKAKLIGEVTIIGVKEYKNYDEWKNDYKNHKIPENSKYKYKNNAKFAYILGTSKSYEREISCDWDRSRGDNYTYRILN